MGILSIAWDEARERAYAYGMTRAFAPIGITAGQYKPGNVKIGMYRHTANQIRQAIADLGGTKCYTNTPAPIFLQYSEKDMVSTVEFETCYWEKESVSDEQSTDACKVEVEFKPMRIRVDGLCAYDDTEEA